MHEHTSTDKEVEMMEASMDAWIIYRMFRQKGEEMFLAIFTYSCFFVPVMI